MRVILLAKTSLADYIPAYRPHTDYVSDSDVLAEQAGRLCYLSWDRPNQKTADNRGYLTNILAQQHYSVLEHSSATFYIDGVTRNFTHELIRHRHLSFSEVSQRYVDVSDFDFVRHPGLNEISDETLNTVISPARSLYSKLVDRFVVEGRSRKQARQSARHVLPSGMETRIVVTGNMRAWREMLPKRLSPMADAEFQQVAALILKELIKIAPNTFQDFVE